MRSYKQGDNPAVRTARFYGAATNEPLRGRIASQLPREHSGLVQALGHVVAVAVVGIFLASIASAMNDRLSAAANTVPALQQKQ